MAFTREVQRHTFDPKNREHLEAFRSLMGGRQHPTLRFDNERFESVPQMMMHKVASHMLSEMSTCDKSNLLPSEELLQSVQSTERSPTPIHVG